MEREIRDLIRQMSSANPLWGRLGSIASCSSSVSKSAKRPSPSTWCENEVRLPRPGAFLRNHAEGIAAIEMFVAASASFRLLYVIIILAQDSRNIVRRP